MEVANDTASPLIDEVAWIEELIWLVSFRQALWQDTECKIFRRACTIDELQGFRALINKRKLICEMVRHPGTKGIALRVYGHPDEPDGTPRLLVVFSHEHLPWQMERPERLDRAYWLFFKLTTTPFNRDFIRHYGLAPTREKAAY